MDYLTSIEEAHRNRCGSERRFCYAAAHSPEGTSVWVLTIVEEDEPGHFPVSDDIFLGDEKTAWDRAHELNRTRLGILARESAMIVASTMHSRGVSRG